MIFRYTSFVSSVAGRTWNMKIPLSSLWDSPGQKRKGILLSCFVYFFCGMERGIRKKDLQLTKERSHGGQNTNHLNQSPCFKKKTLIISIIPVPKLIRNSEWDPDTFGLFCTIKSCYSLSSSSIQYLPHSSVCVCKGVRESERETLYYSSNSPGLNNSH